MSKAIFFLSFILLLQGFPSIGQLADPTIFEDNGTYYLYGTGGNTQGFMVYRSKDLETWSGPLGYHDGYALVKGETFGNKGFWAPHVFKYGGKYFMAYTADEDIAIAESDNPLGPFRQKTIQPLSGSGKKIDPFVFFDNDGKKFLYHVRLENGNRIFVAELNDDLSDIRPGTERECLSAVLPWENTAKAAWPVAEGPTVIRHNNKYYLFYSANDFRNIDYAVGYAVSNTPYGPWKKQSSQPLLSRKSLGQNGTGHGDLLPLPNGKFLYVLHTHASPAKVQPRRTAMVDLMFDETAGATKVLVDTASFRFPSLDTMPSETFTNPLLPSGADPFSFYKDGYYYYTHTLGKNIAIWKTKDLADLKHAERKTIFQPPANTMYSKELWAPEIHFINGRWYVYFAADDGNNNNHRMYVLENPSADPMKGEWTFKGKVSDPSDKWAIDGNVFTYGNQLYMVWSGWEGDQNGQQDIYIAKMKNPWTIESDRVRIASPHYSWEKFGDLNDPNNPPHVNVNEGPQFLQNGDRLFIVYSASGCWTDHYSLGLLSFTGKNDLLDPSKWVKHPEPVFSQSAENGVYAPGHNSFFKSPDGKEDWILYHANNEPGQGCGTFRSPRAQRFTWKADGTPDFGKPVRPGQPVQVPASGPKVNQ